MSTVALPKMLLADEADCHLFKFWFYDRVCDGIRYQDQLFLQLRSFSLDCSDQADAFAAKLIDRGHSVILCGSQERYVLGINPCADWVESATSDKQQASSEGHSRALALFAASVLEAA
ncbi:hypothetical protein H6F89_18300 [Cyanobacteria bacterium FACHB-63]|nr:hypothetical protein [Cyanobacteria bacterium FACHB-63]